jgi:hypothetical protein
VNKAVLIPETAGVRATKLVLKGLPAEVKIGYFVLPPGQNLRNFSSLRRLAQRRFIFMGKEVTEIGYFPKEKGTTCSRLH